MARATEKFLAGDVSRSLLLTTLLPLSTISALGTLIAGAYLFPPPYDWATRTISDLASPRVTSYYWLPIIGVALSGILAMPFAGYMERRLRPIAPRVARTAGVAFTVGFFLLLLACIAVPSHKPTTPAYLMRKFHELVARGCALGYIIGMVCCCWCAYQDRRGRRLFHPSVGACWYVLTFSPSIGLGAALVMLFGHLGHQAWADAARAWFRKTPAWHMAFWEWVAIVVFFTFMLVSVFLLPEKITDSPIVAQPTEPLSGEQLPAPQK